MAFTVLIESPYQKGCDAVHTGEDCPYAHHTMDAVDWEKGFKNELAAWERFCERA
jgi:hypothetical protein